MKKIVVLFLALICTLGMVGCNEAKYKVENGWVCNSEYPPIGKSLSITLTIVETTPSGVAFEYREPNTPYYFYAYDADEHLYRVLWTDWEGLNEKDIVIVEYEKLEELTYDEYPDGGWTPPYEITAVSVRPAEIASCISTEEGAYILTLPKNKETIKNTVGNLSDYLDQVNLVAGLSQSDFISLVGQYRYNGTSIIDIYGSTDFDGPHGGGWLLETHDFSFINNIQLNQEAFSTTYSNKISTSVPLEGLPLPYGIEFEDTLTDVFKKMGIQLNPVEDFQPDASSNILMTLYRDDRYSLVFRNLWNINEPVDFLFPYEICFSETYEIPGLTTIHRTVILRFECADHCGLGEFEISVNEINALE